MIIDALLRKWKDAKYWKTKTFPFESTGEV